MLVETFSNGLTVLCERVSTAPTVALQAWVGVGSADEKPREAGLAHLHEHMLFKGTSRRGVGEIAREIEASGGEVNAWTSFDQTVYHVTMASEFFAAGLDVLADALQHSSFDAAELAREKEVVLEEIRRGDDQPARRLSQQIFSSVFHHHTYGLPIIGTPESVSSFARKDLLAFYQKWYVPNNLTFVIVGDVDPPKAVSAVRRAFAKARLRALRRPARRPEGAARSPRVFAELTDAGDAYAAMAFPIPQLTHADTPGIDLLAEILGGSEASRLFERVQSELQLVTSVYSHAYTPKDPGLFLVSANPYPGKEMAAMQALWHELARIGGEGVHEDEFERAQLRLEADSVYLRETVQGRARKWGFALQLTGSTDFEERYLEAVRRVKREDLRRLARNYLRPQRAAAGIFAPDKGRPGGKARRQQKLSRDLGAIFRKEAARPVRRGQGAAARRAPPASLHRLPNGLRVVIESSHEIPVVAFRAVCLGGSRFERAEEAGNYHFLAEMLARGAGERTATKIRHETEAIAGGAGGVAGRNSTGVEAYCLSRFWRRGLSLFSDLTLTPTFPEDEIERARAETLAAIDRESDSLPSLLFRRLRERLYGGHPYGFRILGTPETVRAVHQESLRRSHARLLDPHHMVVTVVGDVGREDILGALTERFGSLRAKAGPVLQLGIEPLQERHYTEEIMDRSQAHLAVGFLGTTVTAPDRFAMEVLSTVLAGQGGRLFTNLRDKLSLAYSVSAMAVEGLERGLFATYIGTAPEKLATAFDAMRRELETICQSGPSRAELTRAKRHLIASHAIEMQTCEARSSLYGLDELYGLGYRAGEQWGQSISAVTASDVCQAAQRYLRLDRAVLSVIRPGRTPSLRESWLGAGSAPSLGRASGKRRVARARPQRN